MANRTSTFACDGDVLRPNENHNFESVLPTEHFMDRLRYQAFVLQADKQPVELVIESDNRALHGTELKILAGVDFVGKEPVFIFQDRPRSQANGLSRSFRDGAVLVHGRPNYLKGAAGSDGDSLIFDQQTNGGRSIGITGRYIDEPKRVLVRFRQLVDELTFDIKHVGSNSSSDEVRRLAKYIWADYGTLRRPRSVRNDKPLFIHFSDGNGMKKDLKVFLIRTSSEGAVLSMEMTNPFVETSHHHVLTGRLVKVIPSSHQTEIVLDASDDFATRQFLGVPLGKPIQASFRLNVGHGL